MPSTADHRFGLPLVLSAIHLIPLRDHSQRVIHTAFL